MKNCENQVSWIYQRWWSRVNKVTRIISVLQYMIWCTWICIKYMFNSAVLMTIEGEFRSPVSLFVYTIFSILNLWSLIVYWVLRSYFLYAFLSEQLICSSAPMNDRLWWQIIPITNPMMSQGSLAKDGPCVQIGKNTRTRLPMTKRDMKM